MNKFVVITTINLPRFEKLSLFIDAGYEVVIVGDLKTNNTAWENLPKDIHYLSFQDQERMSPELSNLIGPNTYARKNFGYIYAAGKGATIILDTDDDTFFRNSVNCPIKFTQEGKRWEFYGNNTFNPYKFYAPASRIWPRGFPLRELVDNLNSRNLDVRESNQSESDIYQFLVSGEPDVDAIYRLTVSPEPMDFEVNDELVFLHGSTFSPANTQATVWVNTEKFEFLYIPRNVAFRFCDILKMFVAQTNSSIAYGGFLFEQIRNEHDLMKDFESEVDVYLRSELAVKALITHKPDNLPSAYEVLSDSGIVPTDEVHIAQLFRKLINENIDR